MQATDTTIDFVKELRLRAWARRNHVPADERRDSWHAVVLEEMARRDAEQVEVDKVAPAPVTAVSTDDEVWTPVVERNSAFVPLAPEGFSHRVDAAHDGVKAPNLLAPPARVPRPTSNVVSD